MWVRSLGWVDPLEEGMAIHSSIVAWKIPWTEEPGGLQSMGSQRVRYEWAHTHIKMVEWFWMGGTDRLNLCLRSRGLLGSHRWMAPGEKGQKEKQRSLWMSVRSEAVQGANRWRSLRWIRGCRKQELSDLTFQILSSNNRKNRTPINRSRAALIGTITAWTLQGARSRRMGPETGYYSLSAYNF